MEETISLKEIFGILKKHLILILSMMFVGLGLAGIVTFFVITPEYSSRAQLIVTLPQTDNGLASTNDVNTNLLMINTYKEMITGDAVLEQVGNTLNTEYGYNISNGEIKESLSVTQTTNSLMFSIQSTLGNPTLAKDVANVTAQVFQDTAKDVLNDTVDKISIISSATAEMTPVSPNNKLNLAIGLVLGLMIGVGFSFLVELLDKTIKDDKFVTDTLGLTVLGIVPNMTAKELADTINKVPTAQQRPVGGMNQGPVGAGPGVDTRKNRSRI